MSKTNRNGAPGWEIFGAKRLIIKFIIRHSSKTLTEGLAREKSRLTGLVITLSFRCYYS